MAKPTKKLLVVSADKDHCFKEGDIVTLKEKLNHGVIWAVNEKGEFGCLIPAEYQTVKEE